MCSRYGDPIWHSTPPVWRELCRRALPLGVLAAAAGPAAQNPVKSPVQGLPATIPERVQGTASGPHEVKTSRERVGEPSLALPAVGVRLAGRWRAIPSRTPLFPKNDTLTHSKPRRTFLFNCTPNSQPSSTSGRRAKAPPTPMRASSQQK